MRTVLIILAFLSLANSQFVFRESILDKSIKKLEKSSASAGCIDQLKLLSALSGGGLSKSSVISSWSKLPSKIKYGNTFDLGDFNQCMKVYLKVFNTEIIGQHCLFQFYPTSNDIISRGQEFSQFNYGWKHLSERLGGAVCLPAACKPTTVKKFLQYLLDESDFKVAEDYNQADYCKSSQTSKKISKSRKAVFYTTGFLLFCVGLSTVYDFLTRKAENGKQNSWFLAFSLNKNLSNLLQTDNGSTNEVKSLNFIRSKMEICILFAQISTFSSWFPSDQPLDIVNSSMKSVLGLLALSLNTFFVISGFLATRSLIRDLKM